MLALLNCINIQNHFGRLIQSMTEPSNAEVTLSHFPQFSECAVFSGDSIYWLIFNLNLSQRLMRNRRKKEVRKVRKNCWFNSCTQDDVIDKSSFCSIRFVCVCVLRLQRKKCNHSIHMTVEIETTGQNADIVKKCW